MKEPIADKKNTDDTLNVVIVLDRSGSMECIRQSTISAFNTFIGKQRKEAGASSTLISLYLFADTIEHLWSDVPVDRVSDLSSENYWPNGNTALLDAIATAVTETAQRLEKGKPESKPKTKTQQEEVLIVICTDGENNASHKYDYASVRDIIQEKTGENWEFIWLGPNEISRQFALGLGITPENFEFFDGTDRGIQDSCSKISESVSRKKQFGNSAGWKDGDATRNAKP